MGVGLGRDLGKVGWPLYQSHWQRRVAPISSWYKRRPFATHGRHDAHIELRERGTRAAPARAADRADAGVDDVDGMVDLLMVGRVGVDAIGAVALGNVWKIGTAMVAMGVVLGIDPYVSQAHGARDATGLALALQRGIVLALLVSLPSGPRGCSRATCCARAVRTRRSAPWPTTTC